jgi:hypothetical protein
VAATQDRCRDAVIAVLRTLDLGGAEANVYKHTDAGDDETAVKYPCVYCTVADERESRAWAGAEVDAWGYPVRVDLADRQDRFDHRMEPDYELWRERVAAAFHNRQLAAVAENMVCVVEPDRISESRPKRFQHHVTGLVVRCVCHKTRGVSA